MKKNMYQNVIQNIMPNLDLNENLKNENDNCFVYINYFYGII